MVYISSDSKGLRRFWGADFAIFECALGPDPPTTKGVRKQIGRRQRALGSREWGCNSEPLVAGEAPGRAIEIVNQIWFGFGAAGVGREAQSKDD